MEILGDLLHGIDGIGKRAQRLIPFLTASLFLLLFSGCSVSAEVDRTVHSGKKSELLNLFYLEAEFLPDGLITLRFDRDGLDAADKKQCPVIIYLRYVSDNKGSVFSAVSYFNEAHRPAMGIIDTSLKYDGGILLSIDVEKGSCALDTEYSYSNIYYFAEGVLKE